SLLLEAAASRDSTGYCPAEQLLELPANAWDAIRELGNGSNDSFQLGALDPLVSSPAGETFLLLRNDLRRRRVGLGGECLQPPNTFSVERRQLDKEQGVADLSIDVPTAGALS